MYRRGCYSVTGLVFVTEVSDRYVPLLAIHVEDLEDGRPIAWVPFVRGLSEGEIVELVIEALEDEEEGDEDDSQGDSDW